MIGMEFCSRIRRIGNHLGILILRADGICAIQFAGRSLIEFNVSVEMPDYLQETGGAAGIYFRSQQGKVKRVSYKALRS